MKARLTIIVRTASPETHAQAQVAMNIAESSDWFWWYGSDQNSGSDDAFDQQFRDTLDQAAQGTGVVELAIPLDILGNADTGDRLSIRAIFAAPLDAAGMTMVVADQLPVWGPALVAYGAEPGRLSKRRCHARP